jgi:hypothetical protein
MSLVGTKRTFKVLRRRSDVEGRADMARTLPEGDPRYATDFLPRMDGAGCLPGGGGASGSWWPWPRLCQELRTQELAGVLWPTWRRFEPSPSPSATRPSVQASASTNRPKIPEQKWGFRGSWLYWRLPIFGTIGLEKAFFSKASYFVGLVRFRKVKRQRHNLKSKSASVRVSVG